MLIPKLFSDYKPLVEVLKKNAACYPLISKLYIPIIETHSRKYKSFSDFDDWLIIPYFQYLWLALDIKLGKWNRKHLEQIECQLKKISMSLGMQGFEQMSQELLISVMHPAVNGVHNNLLNFFGELKGMEHFINLGYIIERIPREEGKKTPDFLAKKNSEVIVVECKFIHTSNLVQTFIERYDCYLRLLLKLRMLHGIRAWDKLFYIAQPKDLQESKIKEIKKFVEQIVEKQPNSSRINLDLNVHIIYERREIPEINLVPINNQVNFFTSELDHFLNDYVTRRAEQATPQLKGYSDGTKKECIYIFIELDKQYLLPYGGMDCKRKQMEEASKKKIEDHLKENLGLDISVVLEVFPKAVCDDTCIF